MKNLRHLIAAFAFSILMFSAFNGSAQCAMCALNADNSVRNGNKQGSGLNKGIFLLLAAPYVAVAGVSLIWYRSYRRKKVVLNLPDEKINLN